VLVQLDPQEIAPEVELTVPVPFPPLESVSQKPPLPFVKVAVTCAAALIAIVHCVGTFGTGVQFELNPPKLEVPAGAAVSVTAVPVSKAQLALPQLVPQEMPAGLDVTVPVPKPDLLTVSNFVAVKLAVTVAVADTVIWH
jgi:hypothetical protein